MWNRINLLKLRQRVSDLKKNFFTKYLVFINLNNAMIK